MKPGKYAQRSRSGIWLFAVLSSVTLLLGLLVLLAWLKGGFVECSGYLEPDNWVPVYAPGDGIVRKGNLIDGNCIKEGSVVLSLEDDWPRWNLERIEREREKLKAERNDTSRRLSLFRRSRDIEIQELKRRLDISRKLQRSGSITINELKNSEYQLASFLARSEQEEALLCQSLNVLEGKMMSLDTDEAIWKKRLEDCVLTAPAGGSFYAARTIFAGEESAFVPPVGPGQQLEAGTLLGYIIPGGRMIARIAIPQQKIARCRRGQQVLLSLDSRPRWNYAPVRGQLVSISELSSGGFVSAEVEILRDAAGSADDEGAGLGRLSCGDLTARINVSSVSAERLPGRLWQGWVVLVNIEPGRRRPGRPGRTGRPKRPGRPGRRN